MLIENRSCDECGRHCGYLAMLGHYGRFSAQLCDDCLQRGLEEIVDARDLKSKQALDAEEKRRWQELNLQRVGLGLASYMTPKKQ